jgi:hypothetical protein
VNRTSKVVLLALAVALAVCAPASAAKDRTFKKQRFAITFKGEHGQDWQVRPSDDETTPNCVVGLDGTGTSELEASTKKTQTVSLYVNRRSGTAFGDVPVKAELFRTLTLGSPPPDDCDNKMWRDLRDGATCDQGGFWNVYDFSPKAYVSLAAGRGGIAIKLIREDKERLLDEIFPLCPFNGVEEGKIEGQAKLSKARLFDGKTHTVKGFSRHDFPAPADHSVEGFYEWKLRIRAIEPPRRRGN